MKFTLFNEILFGCLIGLLVVIQISKIEKDFVDYALGNETSSYYAKDGNTPIHIGKITESQVDSLISGWIKRGSKDVILILGNSQTHGINQKQKSQISYNHMMFNEFQNEFDIITQSLPNVNFQELYLMMEFWQSKLPIKMVFMPAFLDDMREDGIREVFFKELKSMDFKINSADSLSLSINNAIASFSSNNSSIDDFAALDKTYQEKSENYLNTALDDYSNAWKNRVNLRGEIFTNLYLIRNTILGISAETKRRNIPNRYQRNISALKNILDSNLSKSTITRIYIPPIRNDFDIPYFQKDYTNFKNEVQGIVEMYPKESASYHNLENIVENQFWGYKDGTNLSGKKEVDFMHFQNDGHKVLYKELSKIVSGDL